ncbi:hypothetical protein K443DRAFT_683756 [Laccaria amethystina LaAM-08-1]|uniref:Uncharacterized protein n=1 Tax=Laccaria amethystina LaAM-08-1 TaxID=1095629 RepID=A0A0C9WS54_9AGAR|nr:hypothetical protein K443DRAFT_683756 [Laccaria amethystina LaAM-08-1]
MNTSKWSKTLIRASLYSTHAAATSLPDQLVSHSGRPGHTSTLLPIVKIRHQNEQSLKY